MALPLTPPEPARRARGLRWLTWLWPRRLQQQLVAMVSLVLLLALGVFMPMWDMGKVTLKN